MKKTLVLVAFVVSLVAPALTASPAGAAYEWIRSGCRADVWWYHQPGSYVQYYREQDPWPSNVWLVWENWPSTRPPSHLQVYARNGYECGRMGAPIGDMHYDDGSWWWQQFEQGKLWYSMGWWWWCPVLSPRCVSA